MLPIRFSLIVFIHKKIINGEIQSAENYGDNDGDINDIMKGVKFFFEDYTNSKIGFNRMLP